MKHRVVFGVVAGLMCGIIPAAADLATLSGTWSTEGRGPVWCQRGVTEDIALAVLSVPGEGTAWRCAVEPGPFVGRMGVGFACNIAGEGGYAVWFSAAEGGELRLFGPDQEQLWQDSGFGWMPYMTLWVEMVIESTRARVQLLTSDEATLVAQSPWFPLQTVTADDVSLSAALMTSGTTARFCALGRHGQPLAAYTPDNPSALRVPRAGDTSWKVIGGGAWRWENRDRETLLQTRRVERTTAFQTALLTPEGTWSCRIRLDPTSCGGGLLIHADETLSKGFLIWLGGTYGDGSLMVYRYPLAPIWGGPQGKWHWDTEYLLRCTIAAGTIQASLLEADGTTLVDASPELPLLDGEGAQQGMIGYQTWHGTGHFSGLTVGHDTAVREAGDQKMPQLADIGGGWRAATGEWAWFAGEPERLAQQAPEGIATALCTLERIRGSRGSYQCCVSRKDAQSVSLLFQVSADLAAGFEARYDGTSLQLRSTGGEILWEAQAPGWPLDGGVVLTGVVATDRVRVRLSDSKGTVLLESPDRYVKDTNNERIGALGVRCEGGRAEFREWAWTSE